MGLACGGENPLVRSGALRPPFPLRVFSLLNWRRERAEVEEQRTGLQVGLAHIPENTVACFGKNALHRKLLVMSASQC